MSCTEIGEQEYRQKRWKNVTTDFGLSLITSWFSLKTFFYIMAGWGFHFITVFLPSLLKPQHPLKGIYSAKVN